MGVKNVKEYEIPEYNYCFKDNDGKFYCPDPECEFKDEPLIEVEITSPESTCTQWRVCKCGKGCCSELNKCEYKPSLPSSLPSP